MPPTPYDTLIEPTVLHISRDLVSETAAPFLLSRENSGCQKDRKAHFAGMTVEQRAAWHRWLGAR
jgi:hypothetical protein